MLTNGLEICKCENVSMSLLESQYWIMQALKKEAYSNTALANGIILVRTGGESHQDVPH